MLIVGLTGGIGSGKSTVAEQFAQHNIEIIDTDIISREVVDSDPKVLKEIVNKFGKEILNTDGSLNRKSLASIIFSDKEKKEYLEHILHPRIRATALKRMHTAKGPYCIVIVPLLVETKFYNFVDKVLVIDAASDLQLERVSKRDKISKEEAKLIIKAQTTREERLNRADDIIDNNLSLDEIKEAVEKLHKQYLTIAKKDKFKG